MVRTTSDLLDEYRQANFTKRLHLYLQHRDLRPDFVEADQNEPAAKAPRSMRGFRRLPKFFACCFEKV
jgi:hypothetical protein